MKKVTKSLQVDLPKAGIITVRVTVYGTYDGIDKIVGNKITPVWHIKDVVFDVPDCSDDNTVLSQNEKNELEKLIGERIESENWFINGEF